MTNIKINIKISIRIIIKIRRSTAEVKNILQREKEAGIRKLEIEVTVQNIIAVRIKIIKIDLNIRKDRILGLTIRKKKRLVIMKVSIIYLKLVKKKFEEIAKHTNENTPVSTSDVSKRDRELYVANLPDGLSPSEVTELMNTALIAINANLKVGNPIISTWLSLDKNYAFLEFRTAEEANNAFKLDGINILGKVNCFKVIYYKYRKSK